MVKKTVYFDNAATSWPKPEGVYKAAEIYLRGSGASPGRSSYTQAIQVERQVFETRERAAAFLGAARPEEIIFTLNATDALNMALKGILEPGDHVVYTSLEHNSVNRPLHSLCHHRQVTATMVDSDPTGFLNVQEIANAVNPQTKLIVCTHASNVLGRVTPVKEISRLAREKGVYFLIDAAQTAGSVEIDLQDIKPHLAAFTGHKGLLGPPGVGMLYVRPGVRLRPWREGGTGSRSEEDRQPEMMPDYLEAGTMNAPGLAGLNAGLKFIQETGIPAMARHEQGLVQKLVAGLREIKQVQVFRPPGNYPSTAVVSFILKGLDCGEMGYLLEHYYGIMCRTGLHCAPNAHRTIGTFPQGTVRFSLSYFNREEEIDYALQAIREIARGLQ